MKKNLKFSIIFCLFQSIIVKHTLNSIIMHSRITLLRNPFIFAKFLDHCEVRSSLTCSFWNVIGFCCRSSTGWRWRWDQRRLRTFLYNERWYRWGLPHMWYHREKDWYNYWVQFLEGWLFSFSYINFLFIYYLSGYLVKFGSWYTSVIINVLGEIFLFVYNDAPVSCGHYIFLVGIYGLFVIVFLHLPK